VKAHHGMQLGLLRLTRKAAAERHITGGPWTAPPATQAAASPSAPGMVTAACFASLCCVVLCCVVLCGVRGPIGEPAKTLK